MAEVRDAAGHANVSITSAYLHVAVDDEPEQIFYVMAPLPTSIRPLGKAVTQTGQTVG